MKKDANTLRQEYDKLLETLGNNYELPPLKGTEKQVGWAMDIRIRFVKAVEAKRKTMGLDNFMWIYINILLVAEDACWWIDNKDLKITDILKTIKNNNTVSKENINRIPQKLLDMQYNAHTDTTKHITFPAPSLLNLQPKQQPLPSVVEAIQNKQPSDVVIIDKSDKTKIEIICDKTINLIELCPDIGFTETSTGYIKDVSEGSIEYEGTVNSISLLLLNLGKQVKIENTAKPKEITDGDCTIMSTPEGKLIAICRTEAVYKAMRRIGEITVDITNANKDDVLKLTQHYNIRMNKEVELYLNAKM